MEISVAICLLFLWHYYVLTWYRVTAWSFRILTIAITTKQVLTPWEPRNNVSVTLNSRWKKINKIRKGKFSALCCQREKYKISLKISRENVVLCGIKDIAPTLKEIKSVSWYLRTRWAENYHRFITLFLPRGVKRHLSHFNLKLLSNFKNLPTVIFFIFHTIHVKLIQQPNFPPANPGYKNLHTV